MSRIITLLPVSPRMGPQDDVGQYVDKCDACHERYLHRHGVGVFHQHDAVGNGTWAAKHGNRQWGYGYVVGINLHLFILQLGVGVLRLEHVKSYLEYNESGCDAESVGRYAEECE